MAMTTILPQFIDTNPGHDAVDHSDRAPIIQTVMKNQLLDEINDLDYDIEVPMFVTPEYLDIREYTVEEAWVAFCQNSMDNGCCDDRHMDVFTTEAR